MAPPSDLIRSPCMSGRDTEMCCHLVIRKETIEQDCIENQHGCCTKAIYTMLILYKSTIHIYNKSKQVDTKAE